MSVAALCEAVRNHLRTQLSLDNGECDVEQSAQPPPFIGKRFVSVHPTYWRPAGNFDDGLHEIIGLDCTLTFAAAQFPQDRIGGELFLKALTGMEKLARDIVLQIDRSYTVMAAANALITSGTDKFQVPLFWEGTDGTPAEQDGTWIFAAPETCAFLVLGVHFGRAERHQTISGRT